MRMKYLEKHPYANEDIGLLQCSQTSPSRPKTTDTRLMVRGFSSPVSLQQFPLLSTDAQQLHHIGLEESNAKGKIDAHDPELSRTQKVPICCICQKDLDQVDMKE